MKQLKLLKGEVIVNSSNDKKLILTKKYETVHFTLDEDWDNVEIYTLYKLKNFLGLFEYWSSYSNISSKKVFKKFQKSLKKNGN